MMNNQDNFKSIAAGALTSRPGAALFVGIMMMIERIGYYGLRFVIVLALLDERGDTISFLRNDSRLIYCLAALLSGVIMDFLLDKRIAMISGAFCFGLGVATFLLPNDEFIWLIGMVLTSFGASMINCAFRAYFGHLIGTDGVRLEGAYGFLMFAAQLGGVLCSLVLLFLMYNDGIAPTVLLVCGLAGLQFMALLIALVSGFLPKEARMNPDAGTRRISDFWGMALLPAIAFAFVLCLLTVYNTFGLSSGELILGPVILLLVMGAMLMLMVAPGKAKRHRNFALFGIIVAWLCIYVFREVASTIDARSQMSPFGSHGNVGQLLAGISTSFSFLIIGVVLFFNEGSRNGNGAGIRLMMGILVLLVGGTIGMLVPIFGQSLLVVQVLIVAVGESLSYSVLNARSWWLAPAHLKGTMTGIIVAIGFFPNTIASLFDPGNLADGSSFSTLPYIGFFIFGMLALGAGLFTWRQMRHYRAAIEETQNPFE